MLHVYVIYDLYTARSSQEKPLFHKRDPLYHTFFFTLFVFSRASDNTTSQNIGGKDAWAIPLLKFGGPSTQSLLGLRPCIAILKLVS